MATDQFGGVLVPDITVVVDKPTVDTFGGTLVEQSETDEFGGALITEDPDVLEQLSYGFDATPSFSENMALWAESRMPLGDIVFTDDGIDYRSPEELYGQDFINASPEERRVMLLDQRQKQIEQEYADVIKAGQTDTLAAQIGGLGGALADPSTLLPVGATYRGMAVIGGLLGFGYDSADQLAQTGQIDPVQAGTTAAVTAVATPAVAIAAKTVGKAIGNTVSKITRKKTDDIQVRDASTAKMDEVNDAVAEAVVKGVPESDVPKFVQNRVRITPDEFETIVANSETKFKIPSLEEAKLIAEAKALKTNPISARSKFPTIDSLFGALHTRVKNISPTVASGLRKFEMRSHVNSEKYMRRVEPFIKKFNKLNKKTQQAVSRHLFNGNFNTAKGLMKASNPKLADDFDEVRNVLKNLYDDMKVAGYEVAEIPNYFPRLVKDVNALREKLSGTQNGMIEAAWKARAKQLGTTVAKLPEEDKIQIVNNIARGYVPKTVGTKLTFVEGRTIKNVTEDILDDYANPMESLHAYIRQTTHNIEKRRFFGQSAKNKGMADIDLEESIGGLITKEIAKNNINMRDQAELADLLQSRFGFGEKAPSKWIQDIRNISYSTTIGNPISALTQLGDVGVATYVNGFRNTIKAVLGPKRIRMQDLGLEDTIAQEFVSTNSTGKFLNKLFSYTGFRAIDRFGKNTLINGSLNKAQALVKSTKGTQKLKSKYGEVFGDEFDLLVNDLRAGKITDNVKLYLWNELSDVQPISLTEMPQQYLNSPNGRIFYALKTFTLKQLDLIRNDIFAQIARGNYTEGGKNLVRYMTIVPFMGATVDEVKDAVMGRGLNPDEIPDNYINNFFKIFAVSEYARENSLDDGRFGTFIQETATPAIISQIDAIGTSLFDAFSGEEVNTRFLRALPGIGPFIYNFFGGGLDKFEQEKFEEAFKLAE